MVKRINLRSLLALMLAGAMLVGCGGDAEPPPPVGEAEVGPDTTPPTVSIASDVSAQPVTGPVTFTFVFDEDVGVSFDQTDITVGGGSAGAFTRIDGRQATLVVSPPLGVAGTMSVSVDAGRFTDLTGNANTEAASKSLDYAVTQVITFTSPGDQVLGTATSPLSASASSGLPVTITSTTTTVCTVSGTALTLVAAGTCSLTANQAGNATFVAAPPVTQTFAVTGGVIADAVFSTGFAGGNRTVEGGEFGGFSGSNLDGFNCSGDPAWCGSGGDTVPNVAAADSFFFYYYQTPTPATDLYMGIFVLAPGVTGSLSPTGDSPGVQVNGQTALKFKVGQNPEWFSTTTKNFAVDLTLGKRYVVNGNTCRVQLRTIVTPTAATATEYSVLFSAFIVVQDCGQGGLTVASALAASPVSQVSFQGVGGGIALSAGGKTSGANLSEVAAIGRYPTTLVLVGGIKFAASSAPPPVAKANFSTGFAAANRTVEGGEFGGFSGSNLDGFNCSGDPAWCGSGGDTVPAVAAADSFFFYYYQTPTPATDLYMGIFVLAPGVTGGLSPTGDSPGVQVNGQTALKFKVGQNPEWFSTTTKNFAVDLTLGKRYVVNGNTCRVQLRTIVTPTAAAATEYSVLFSAFIVVQDCGQGGLTVASALAASPVSQVSFQGVGGGIALSAGGKTSGANLSEVAANGRYPTTLVLVGGISFEP